MGDEGLRHLLYLVDVNRLFDIALGTYDFNIVMMVAEKSQKVCFVFFFVNRKYVLKNNFEKYKDPKEYLPFLNELQKLEEDYRKYKIDLHLKRYKKALISIAKCDESHHDELLKLVNEQKLYSEALNYFKVDTNMFKVLNFSNSKKETFYILVSLFKEISNNFACYLSNKKYYQEAGLILLRAKLYQEALEAFEKSNDWRMYLSVCSQLCLKPNELKQKIEKLATNLKDNNKNLEAAVVFEQYLNVEIKQKKNTVNACKN